MIKSKILDKKKEFITILLKWFKYNKRDFSWRKIKLTPFQQLVVELMLQKTNANQVEKIFPKFIQKYPTIRSVFIADEKELAKELKTLGLFNRRARDLKKISKYLIENGEQLPKTKKELMKLPGIGSYIANSILCFVFNKPVPMIDSNVGRVIKRVFSFPVKNAPSRDKNLEKFMMELIPKSKFKIFNYAILDFAALVCTPKSPKCSECDLKKICDKMD
ncbi:MAG: hypothetical protein ACP6IY_21045 [Promethearchaeia archaeon]